MNEIAPGLTTEDIAELQEASARTVPAEEPDELTIAVHTSRLLEAKGRHRLHDVTLFDATSDEDDDGAA